MLVRLGPRWVPLGLESGLAGLGRGWLELGSVSG